MAPVANNDEMIMATDVMAPGAEKPEDRRPPEPRAEKGVPKQGFFTIYKKGQGYWTRMCSAAAAGLIVILTASFVWQQLPPWLTPALTPDNATGAQLTLAAAKARNITLGVCGAILAGASLLAWYIMNKSGNVDFLIATDSEMKKVNWTSRRELIGSTKVVIIFMFLIAALLFMLDMYFTRVFYLAGVLVGDSPMWMYVGGWFGAAGRVTLDVVMGVVVFGSAAWAIYGASHSR